MTKITKRSDLPKGPVYGSTKPMERPRAFTFATLLVLAVYLSFASSGWPVGLCYVGMEHCAAVAGPSHDCADPCSEALPTHRPCASHSPANSGSTHCACDCSFGPLAGPRYYLATESGQQISQRLHESFSVSSMPPAILSAVTLGRHLTLPEPSDSGQKTACLRTIILLC